jgi:hypothetical protein
MRSNSRMETKKTARRRRLDSGTLVADEGVPTLFDLFLNINRSGSKRNLGLCPVFELTA